MRKRRNAKVGKCRAWPIVLAQHQGGATSQKQDADAPGKGFGDRGANAATARAIGVFADNTGKFALKSRIET